MVGIVSSQKLQTKTRVSKSFAWSGLEFVSNSLEITKENKNLQGFLILG